MRCFIVLAIAAGCGSCSRSSSTAADDQTVVLYCATDREIVQDLIDQFQKQTGIKIQAKFDTEAAKAVGLVSEIRQEKSHPQCDVFWGGGAFFNTILANDGCLTPAPADLIAAHGDAPRDPQGRWLGFAGVWRVLIVNTQILPNAADRPHSYRDLIDPKFKGHIGIANPMFGGMAAHTAALFSVIGEPAGRQWLRGLKANDCALCAGMADVKNRVAQGELWFGIGSTVDAHVAVDQGYPVQIIYPDQQPGEIGAMNGFNTVALVAGGPHPAAAEKLLRFLMSTDTEKILADGPAQNFGILPDSVKQNVRPKWMPADVRAMNIDWSAAVNGFPAVQQAIKDELQSP